MLTTIEASCLRNYEAQGEPPEVREDDVQTWVSFSLHLLLEAGSLLRDGRLAQSLGDLGFKSDHSPAIDLEVAVEQRMRERLEAYFPAATPIGEEGGGTLPKTGIAVAIDPLDGTWAFVNGVESFSSTLAIFRDGEAVLGMIANPATGEIGYATIGQEARLLQLGCFGSASDSRPLPLPASSTGILVNVHPSRSGAHISRALHKAWERQRLGIIRSPGGSPASALLESAKGRFIYVNAWSTGGTEPHDLAAGVLVLRSAGGDVVDLHGRPIDALHHQGPFVAGVDASARERVAGIVRLAVNPDA